MSIINNFPDGAGSGGHIIVDFNGTEYTSRSKLKFGHGVITDDPTNDTTLVEIDDSAEPITLTSWAAGTNAEIAAILKASKDGDIDLYEDAGWRVGDERQVTLSAMAATGVGESHVEQTVTMVLVNKGGKYDSSNRECSFIMQPKNCLLETGYINDTGTNSGGWTSSARRTWCNNVYLNALPSYISSYVMPVANKTSAGNQSTTINTDYDYCALPSSIEVGHRISASPYIDEGTQWSYYTDNTTSRIKKVGDSGNACDWWLRSPWVGGTANFCLVYDNGLAGGSNANVTYALAPFCCIY